MNLGVIVIIVLAAIALIIFLIYRSNIDRKELEEEFVGRFVRVHRNSLVSIKHIEALERNGQGQYQVRLADTLTRPIISRRHVSDLKELLKMI